MIPATRKDAIAAGLRFFRTGKPCRRGHVANRYTSTGNCVECTAAARDDAHALAREAVAARFSGSELFTYRLHPDDHAAALAFCQALDLQRGRLPHTPGTPPPAPVGQLVLPPHLAEAHKVLDRYPAVVDQHEALPRYPGGRK